MCGLCLRLCNTLLTTTLLLRSVLAICCYHSSRSLINSEDEIQHLDTMVKVIEKRLHEQWSRNIAKAQHSATNSSSTAAVADNSNIPDRDTATTTTVATTTAATVTPHGSNSLKPCSSTDNILAPTTDNSHHSDSYGAV
jgi:hypothetical protein